MIETGTPHLPTASPANVYRLFQELRNANAHDSWSQADLEARKFGQKKQVRTCIEWADLLEPGPSRRLKQEILDAQRNGSLREELRRRVIAALERSGCDTEKLAFFGKEDLIERELTNNLKAVLPIDATDSPTKKSSILGFFRSLHLALLHINDPNWLDREVKSLEKRSRKRRTKQTKADRAGDTDKPVKDGELTNEEPPAMLRSLAANPNVASTDIFAHLLRCPIGDGIHAVVHLELPSGHSYSEKHIATLADKIRAFANILRED